MSIGYNLEGIKTPRMTWFMDTMADASEPLSQIKEIIRREFPQFADIEIPTQLTNSVTLSTMHGCPPDEIERIARYTLEERGLHTIVKMNPTLLGKEPVLGILHDSLGLRGDSHPRRGLRARPEVCQGGRADHLAASRSRPHAGLIFGVKLSNTLAMHNHTRRMPGDEMYMSGRALYPVTMNLYDKLSHEFNGDLNVSYSAGADAMNIATILSCGALPVTGCSDLLKPGGYARMTQWLESLGAAMAERGAASLAELSRDKLANVEAAAAEALVNPRYNKHQSRYGLPKVKSGLGLWDCVVAPCVEACAVEQDVPEYAWLIAQGEYDRALEVILARNPLPGVTGYVCTHLCQTRCTRNDYEETVAIRALKRIAEERGKAGYGIRDWGLGGKNQSPIPNPQSPIRRVAIIGSGPSGLGGRRVPGGERRADDDLRGEGCAGRHDARGAAVPPALGDHPAGHRPHHGARRGDQAQHSDHRAAGGAAEAGVRRGLPGQRVPARHAAARAGRRGAGRDARAAPARPLAPRGVGGPGQEGRGDRRRRHGDGRVRTSQRFTGNPVTILYRRTRHEMPAAEEELEGALEEGNILEELVAPVEVLRDPQGGKVSGIKVIRNRLGEPGPDGRRSPVDIPGSEFVVPCDSVIVAVGQLPELTFLDGSQVARHKGGGVLVDEATRCAGPDGVYAGGDVVIKPDSIIAACADGRKAAEAICEHLCVPFSQPASRPATLSEQEIIEVKAVRARKIPQVKPAMMPVAQRIDFKLIEATFTEEEARIEGLRCVQCTTFCDKCVEVCPNRANYTFRMEPVHWHYPCSPRVIAG